MVLCTSWCGGLYQDAQNWLIAQLGFDPVKINRNTKHTRSAQFGGGGCQVEMICRLLYENASVYLDRKYQKFIEVCNRSPNKRKQRQQQKETNALL